MSACTCCIQIAHVDCQINSWESIVFFWDYVYGITALDSDVVFLFLVFQFLYFFCCSQNNLIQSLGSYFCDGLLIFGERFLSLVHHKEIKQKWERNTELRMVRCLALGHFSIALQFLYGQLCSVTPVYGIIFIINCWLFYLMNFNKRLGCIFLEVTRGRSVYWSIVF